MFKGLGSQRLVAVFGFGWLALNFPLLSLWDKDVTVFGVPLFPAALFALWVILIAAVGWLMERSAQVRKED